MSDSKQPKQRWEFTVEEAENILHNQSKVRRKIWSWRCFWQGHKSGPCLRCNKVLDGSWESRFWFCVNILGIVALVGLAMFGGIVLLLIAVALF